MNVSFLSDLMQTVAERGRALMGLRRPMGAGRAEILRLADDLLSRRGEASGVAVAGDILAAYDALPPSERREVLIGFAERFGPNMSRLVEAAKAFTENPGLATAGDLHAVSEPRRQELIRRLNLAPGGTPALVRMREDLLAGGKGSPAVDALDRDFVHLFSSWFNRGFLVLRRIDWSTPANILEKIIHYEAVHTIADWNELRARLDPPDRRLYAFFHPALVDEPLIFVEVALMNNIPGAIAPVLAAARMPIAAADARTAVFYSISNTQRGLTGVSFGHFLIKQVVEELKRELPKLESFVTLSPIPGFAAWLDRERQDEASILIGEEDRQALAALEAPRWHEKPATMEGADRLLLPLAAHYFLRAKTPDGRPLDPVARFHLGNGARLERLNAMGDASDRALRQSYGLMANYLYDLDHIEANHEAFADRGEVVASSAVRRLMRNRPTPVAPVASLSLKPA
ncbi:MAG: malonyl-CoA decarboxylase [Methylobacteriaceae bacterium]|nr:malonyl-CoA decarboxylase [Methylobacteriaceae bacterium]MBV9704377.1 malonyl-CoA decarboxylase [Methylobacteriaceae bacterium]